MLASFLLHQKKRIELRTSAFKICTRKRNEPQTDCNGADADINQIKLEQRRVGEMSYIKGTSKRQSDSTGLLITGKLVKTEIQ